MADYPTNTADEITVADVLACVLQDPRDAEIARLKSEYAELRTKFDAALQVVLYAKGKCNEAAQNTKQTREELEKLQKDYDKLMLAYDDVFSLWQTCKRSWDLMAKNAALSERLSTIANPCRN